MRNIWINCILIKLMSVVLVSGSPGARLSGTWCRHPPTPPCIHMYHVTPAVTWSEAATVCTDVTISNLSLSNLLPSAPSRGEMSRDLEVGVTPQAWVASKRDDQGYWYDVDGNPARLDIHMNRTDRGCGVYRMMYNNTVPEPCVQTSPPHLAICQLHTTEGSCPPNTTQIMDLCYTIPRAEYFKKWRDASRYCEQTYPGGQLAHNYLSNSTLASYVTHALTYPSMHSANTKLWVGVRRYHWMWLAGNGGMTPVLEAPWMDNDPDPDSCLTFDPTNSTRSGLDVDTRLDHITRLVPVSCHNYLTYVLCQGTVFSDVKNTTDVPDEASDSGLSIGHIITICVGLSVVLVLIAVIILLSRRIIGARRQPPLIPSDTDDPSTLCADNPQIAAWHGQGSNSEFGHFKIGPYTEKPVSSTQLRVPEVTEL